MCDSGFVSTREYWQAVQDRHIPVKLLWLIRLQYFPFFAIKKAGSLLCPVLWIPEPVFRGFQWFLGPSLQDRKKSFQPCFSDDLYRDRRTWCRKSEMSGILPSKKHILTWNNVPLLRLRMVYQNHEEEKNSSEFFEACLSCRRTLMRSSPVSPHFPWGSTRGSFL